MAMWHDHPDARNVPSAHVVTAHASEVVVVAAAAGYALNCVLNIIGARILSATDYGAFSAAVSMVAIICTIATLGLEKCALRLLPEYVDLKSQSMTKGYIVFGVTISVCVGACAAVGAFVIYDSVRAHDVSLDALAHMLWFVPAMALFLFAIEVATALGSWMGSTVVYRILLPASAAGAVAASALFDSTPTLREVINMYGLAWVAALVVMIVIVLRRLPTLALRATSLYASKDWLTQGVGYLGFSLIMTIFTQGAIVVLEVVRGDRVGVGMVAAAMQVAGFVIIAQTATMRIYGPQLARLIARGDAHNERMLLRSRGRFMIVVCGAFFAVIVLFGHDLLALFGEQYRAAYPMLVTLAIGNCINTLLGFAPSILQYHGAHRLTITIAAVGTTLALLAMAVAAHVGTSLEVTYAYSISLTAMYIAFQVAAMRRVWLVK